MFDAKKFIDEKVSELSAQISGKAIIGCSGGVDSTAAAVMVSRAIGERLLAVYVDTGLMRKGETPYVEEMMKQLETLVSKRQTESDELDDTTAIGLEIL